MKLNVPVYNPAGLRELGRLSPFLEPDDTIMLVSGNVDNPLDVGWLDESLALLRTTYPEQQVLVATAGSAHLGQLASAGLRAAGLVYVYEPFANVPEFSWAFDETLANVERAADAVRSRGFQMVFKPTGRPLFQANLARYGWNYGALAERADRLFVQMQTYCHKGNFDGAVAKLGLECVTQLTKTYTQVTVDRAARNGVPADAAVSCARAAADHGFAGVTVWWSPRYTAEAVAFLRRLRP